MSILLIDRCHRNKFGLSIAHNQTAVPFDPPVICRKAVGGVGGKLGADQVGERHGYMRVDPGVPIIPAVVLAERPVKRAGDKETFVGEVKAFEPRRAREAVGAGDETTMIAPKAAMSLSDDRLPCKSDDIRSVLGLSFNPPQRAGMGTAWHFETYGAEKVDPADGTELVRHVGLPD